MDARNLATVIGPNLFRSSPPSAASGVAGPAGANGSANQHPAVGADPGFDAQLLNSVQSQTAFVRILITHLAVEAETRRLLTECGEA